MSFQKIYARAIQNKGGNAELKKLLPPLISHSDFINRDSSRVLSCMSQCVFQSGFVWRVIKQKWPEFEDAFYQFNIKKLLNLPPDKIADYINDKRIVRNPIKIESVFQNAIFIAETETKKQKTFAQVLYDWPIDDQIGLMTFLKKNGSRLGGMTGQYFLRSIGKDSFILSNDVVLCLQNEGLDIHHTPSSLRDFKQIQAWFNTAHQQTNLPMTHLSKIMAYSIGNNPRHT